MGAHIGEWTRDHTDQCPARLNQECRQGTGHRLRVPHPPHPVRSGSLRRSGREMPQVSKPRTQELFSQAHLLFCRSSPHPGQGNWISSCLSGHQSIERCLPPSQGTWQRHPYPLPSSPIASLPGGRVREGIQQAEGASRGTPTGLRPTHPPADLSPRSAPAPRLCEPYLGTQPGRERGAGAPSAGRRPPGPGGSPCHRR